METPSSDSVSSSPSSSASDAAPAPVDRDSLIFLGRQLIPAEGDRLSRPVRDALRRAVRDGRLAPLQRLSGRHRHELLLALENAVSSRRRPAPEVVVRLTTVVSAIPALPALAEVAASRPAR